MVQTRTGSDGNCLNACIASILELPLKSVPEFGDDWEADLNAFLADHGLRYRRVPMYKKPSGWSTIEGVSPRGGLHACVAHDGELVWDPHPIEDGTGQGLIEPRYYGLLEPLLGVTGKELGEQAAKGLDSRMELDEYERRTANLGDMIEGYKRQFKWPHADREALRAAIKRCEARIREIRAEYRAGQAKDSGYACKFCERPVERRYKNNVCQYCLEKAHQAYLVDWKAAKARVGSARGDVDAYRLAVAELKAIEKRPRTAWLTAKATDRDDMMELRKNTEKQGGPFFIQETTKSGRERTIPVRQLAKGADAFAAGFEFKDNSAMTWNSAEVRIRMGWLIHNGLPPVACSYSWNEQTSKVQNAFVDWYRANHNV